MIIINYDYAIMQYTCPDIGKKRERRSKSMFCLWMLDNVVKEKITVHEFVKVKIEFTKFWELDKWQITNFL